MYQEYAGVLGATGGALTAAAATGSSLSFMAGRCGGAGSQLPARQTLAQATRAWLRCSSTSS
jgi:hypothetical protein